MTTRQRRANYSSQKYTIKAAKDKMEKENLIIGRNTVKEAIKSGRDIDFIMVQSGSDDRSIKDISAMAKKNGIAIKQVPKTKLDEISMPYGYGGKPANHQGIAAQIPSAKYSIVQIKGQSKFPAANIPYHTSSMQKRETMRPPFPFHYAQAQMPPAPGFCT